MLVLTRKLGENILIGDNISVKVVNIENNKVQLGIQAPDSIMIYRQELVEKVKKQNQSSILYRKNEWVRAFNVLKTLYNLK